MCTLSIELRALLREIFAMRNLGGTADDMIVNSSVPCMRDGVFFVYRKSGSMNRNGCQKKGEYIHER